MNKNLVSIDARKRYFFAQSFQDSLLRGFIAFAGVLISLILIGVSDGVMASTPLGNKYEYCFDAPSWQEIVPVSCTLKTGEEMILTLLPCFHANRMEVDHNSPKTGQVPVFDLKADDTPTINGDLFLVTILDDSGNEVRKLKVCTGNGIVFVEVLD